MCIKLDLSILRGDHTQGVFNNKVLAAILGPHKLEETEKKSSNGGFHNLYSNLRLLRLLTLKDEAQTALFKDPVRTAL